MSMSICMQDTETPTTKLRAGEKVRTLLSSDICLLYVVLRMQTCCSGVCRTYTIASRHREMSTGQVHEETPVLHSEMATPGGAACSSPVRQLS